MRGLKRFSANLFGDLTKINDSLNRLIYKSVHLIDSTVDHLKCKNAYHFQTKNVLWYTKVDGTCFPRSVDKVCLKNHGKLIKIKLGVLQLGHLESIWVDFWRSIFLLHYLTFNEV